jgi:hypothetical protein
MVDNDRNRGPALTKGERLQGAGLGRRPESPGSPRRSCYVIGAELRDAESVLTQLGGWFADTTQAPHSPGRTPGGVLGDSTHRAPICLTT